MRAPWRGLAGILILLWCGTCDLVWGGELFLIGAVTSGSYGTESDSESREARLVYVVGDKLQFRADISLLNVESEVGIRPSPGGPLPGGPRSRLGPREAGGSGSGGGSDGNGAGGQGGGAQTSSAEGSTDESAPVEPDPISATGLGDLHLAVSHLLAGGGSRLLRVDGGLMIKVPTASSDDGLGTGEWDVRLGLTSEYRFWSATGFAGLGWSYYGNPEWGELKNGVNGYLGLESEPLGDGVVLSGWLEGNPEIVAGVGTRVAAGIGLRTTGNVRWRVSTTFGLTDAAEDFGAVFGVSTGIRTPTVGTRGPRR